MIKIEVYMLPLVKEVSLAQFYREKIQNSQNHLSQLHRAINSLTPIKIEIDIKLQILEEEANYERYQNLLSYALAIEKFTEIKPVADSEPKKRPRIHSRTPVASYAKLSPYTPVKKAKPTDSPAGSLKPGTLIHAHNAKIGMRCYINHTKDGKITNIDSIEEGYFRITWEGDDQEKGVAYFKKNGIEPAIQKQSLVAI